MKLPVIAAPLAALLGLALWPHAEAMAAKGDQWSVDRSNVNVRSGPSTNAEILMTINPGETIVEIAEKGDWYFVEFPNYQKRGWVYAPLLTAAGSGAADTKAAVDPATPAPTPATEIATAPAPAVPVVEEAAPAAPVASTAGGSEQPAPETATTASTTVATVSPGQEPAAVKSFRDTVAELNERAVSVAGINLFSDVRSIGGGGVQVLATDTWSSVPEAGQSSYMNALFERWQSVANGLGPLSLQIVDPSGTVMMERSGS